MSLPARRNSFRGAFQMGLAHPSVVAQRGADVDVDASREAIRVQQTSADPVIEPLLFQPLVERRASW